MAVEAAATSSLSDLGFDLHEAFNSAANRGVSRDVNHDGGGFGWARRFDPFVAYAFCHPGMCLLHISFRALLALSKGCAGPGATPAKVAPLRKARPDRRLHRQNRRARGKSDDAVTKDGMPLGTPRRTWRNPLLRCFKSERKRQSVLSEQVDAGA
jgi:hypothetical protein